MADGFICSGCCKHRAADLHDQGKRKPICRVCEAHRKHAKKAKEPLAYTVFEANYLDRIRLKGLGLKRCTSCFEEKPKDAKWGGGHCWPCHLERTRKWKAEKRPPKSRIAEYRKQNRRRGCVTYGGKEEALIGWRKKWRRRRLSRLNHGAHVADYFRWLKSEATDAEVAERYEARGKPWNNPRLTWAEKWRMRYRMDEEFAIGERIRHQRRKAAARAGMADHMRLGLVRDGRSRVVEKELGYSIYQLRQHLERQFIKGMTWGRFRAGDIHIDHITPQAAFDLRDPEQWIACWCLSNLRPCWAGENRRKRDRIEFLL